MIYWTKYKSHEPQLVTKKKKIFDNNIYSFDIEVTSYIKLNGVQYSQDKYDEFNQKEKDKCECHSIMYIWMFGINDTVYYGRTWDELKEFLHKVDKCVPEKKFIYIHNLSYEFQFLRGEFLLENVMARTQRKVMKCKFVDYNFELRCSYFLSNTNLENLAKVYNLPFKKMVGDLDYKIIRSPETPLSEEELGYCENDCLIIYYYILMELETYETIDRIPITSTGKVRRELKDLMYKDFSYRLKASRACSIDPHVFNLLNECFMGGYTHANYMFSDEIINDVDSYDFTSSYPYCMVAYPYPSSEFKKCILKSKEDMVIGFAYLLVVKFTNISCRYYNTFISASKCRNLRGAYYDNGRVISASELTLTLTDIDFHFILSSYDCEYEILESYYSNYNYLPPLFYNFILDKYVKKTKLKNVEGSEIEYQLEKGKFNSLYGMSVTNEIKAEVEYDNTLGWIEKELTNEQIEVQLIKQKKKGFMAFSWGCWITAYARRNLLQNICKLDEYMVYADTDSVKLRKGYKKSIIEDYNKKVKQRLKRVSKLVHIPMEMYEPKDINGEKHLLGVFECETKKGRKYTYDSLITQGAKKYAVSIDGDIKITVAGVPKGNGSKALKDLNDFRDDFEFKAKDTGKKTIVYLDEQYIDTFIDCNGNEYVNKDKTGCCILPCSYVLGKALDYAELLTDSSSQRAIYREEMENYE